MILEKMKVYGVDGVGGPPDQIYRTDDAKGLGYTFNEFGSEITSDFNNCYPWSGMTEVSDDLGNTFVCIPRFYSRIKRNDDGTYKYQISGCRYEGFSTLFIDGRGHEIDYVRVGKYEGSGGSTKLCSATGEMVLTNKTIGQIRDACVKNGKGYQQYDFLIDAILKQLFLIEFATTDSQYIMRGWTNPDNVGNLRTGATAGLKTSSGSSRTGCDDESGHDPRADGHHACIYRGMENLWGNVMTWCDGILFVNEKIYICTDPRLYSSDISDGYTYVGDRPTSDGYSAEITPFEKFPLLAFTTRVTSEEKSGYPDYFDSSKAQTVLCVGGSRSKGSECGLWAQYSNATAKASHSHIGGRLCWKPI